MQQEQRTRLLRRMMLAINRIDGAYYLFARRRGIHENTLALLYALDDGTPHSQKQVCEEWLIPKTTINTIVRQLEGEGLLTLQAGEHGREKTICLTPAGSPMRGKSCRMSMPPRMPPSTRRWNSFPPILSRHWNTSPTNSAPGLNPGPAHSPRSNDRWISRRCF